MIRLKWIICLAISACTPAASPPTATPASPSTSSSDYPCWPVAPMRLLVLEHGGNWEPAVEMQGDGTIYRYQDGARRFVTRVKNDALLDAHEVPSLTCIHREIAAPGAAEAKAGYDEHDTYFDDRTHIIIADDGTVTVSGSPGVGARIEGPIAKTRRTAALLVITALSMVTLGRGSK